MEDPGRGIPSLELWEEPVGKTPGGVCKEVCPFPLEEVGLAQTDVLGGAGFPAGQTG